MSLTHNDVLLAAARLLTREFTGPDLVVRCWIMRRAWFGLRGYEDEYPDANRVYARLDGWDGLTGRAALIEPLGSRTYRLTPRGRDMAEVAAAKLREADAR